MIPLIRTLVWPLTLLVVLVFLRKPIRTLLTNARLTTVSAFGVSVEFARVTEVKLDWSGPGGSDYRSSTVATEIGGSYKSDLTELLDKPLTADYAVLDLGEGNLWLTSRLYLFANLLARKGLRAFVFVGTDTDQGIRGRFIGIASLDEPRWRLVDAFPWMEQAFAKAYADGGDTHNGKLGAAPFITNYLKHEEIHSATKPPTAPEQWVDLGSKRGWEHAQWIDAVSLRKLLDRSLSSARVAEDLPTSEQVRCIVHKQGAFVALVDDDRRFKALVDRFRLAEAIARRASDGP
jgi:hypothetical protein